MNGKFELSEQITNNILKEEQNAFIIEHNLSVDYSHSGKSFNFFVQECIQDGRLKKYELDEFLFESLFYGYQRETYIYKIGNYQHKSLKTEPFLEAIQREYAYVNDCMFNEITSRASYEEELVAIKVSYSKDLKRIVKVRLIFKRGISVITKGGVVKTLSYIPIEWDVAKGSVVIKISPKRRLYDKSLKPEYLNKHFFEILKGLFDLVKIPYGNIHKEAICEMSKELYNQIYQKMVITKPIGLDEFVEDIANSLKEKLGIEALELKATINNIFNVKDSLQKQVENILISDILLDVEQGASLEGIEGVVTYLKFSDGKKISARLKGKECRDPIFDSESYMALRSAIENARQTSRLGIVWLKQFDRLRIWYDATDAECLNIHFYKNLKKEEFEYGLQMYEKFERRRDERSIKPLKLEARAQ